MIYDPRFTCPECGRAPDVELMYFIGFSGELKPGRYECRSGHTWSVPRPPVSPPPAIKLDDLLKAWRGLGTAIQIAEQTLANVWDPAMRRLVEAAAECEQREQKRILWGRPGADKPLGILAAEGVSSEPHASSVARSAPSSCAGAVDGTPGGCGDAIGQSMRQTYRSGA